MGKIAAAAAALGAILIILIGGGVMAIVQAIFGASSSQPSTTALAHIPPDYLALYQQAATICPGLNWTILAAIGKIESDHGRSRLPGAQHGENNAGAGGPMQILKTTWDAITTGHPIPPGGATPPSRYNPHDAIYAAAYYLCDNGARDSRDLHAAIFAYNHANWYVNAVLTQAEKYASTATTGTGDCNNIQAPNTATLAAINYACGHRGLPYVWGGNGPHNGGFDCSGLTKAAYAAAGITLPRTADAQYRAGPHIPHDQPLLPGDLVFYGTQAHVHHVGLYLGAGLIINAPDFGQVVKTEPYLYPGADYLGATRPAVPIAAE